MYKPTKKSAHFYAKHYQDNYPNLGYDYRGNIFKNTISKGILKNTVNNSILLYVETMIIDLIDKVKQIRTYFMISVDKNERNLN